jgi:hypothetical protein
VLKIIWSFYYLHNISKEFVINLLLRNLLTILTVEKNILFSKIKGIKLELPNLITCSPILICHLFPYTDMSLAPLYWYVTCSPILTCHLLPYTDMSLVPLYWYVTCSPILICHLFPYTDMSLAPLYWYVTCSPILICHCMGDLKKPYYRTIQWSFQLNILQNSSFISE